MENGEQTLHNERGLVVGMGKERNEIIDTMDTTIEKALRTMLENWEKMKKSHEEDAEEDANQFEASFYALMEQVRHWFGRLETKPETLEEALLLPDMAQIADLLPAEIYLNFETELELIVEGQTRVEDERYD